MLETPITAERAAVEMPNVMQAAKKRIEYPVVAGDLAARPVAIDFNNVKKEYVLYRNDRDRLVGALSGKRQIAHIGAARKLSFSIERGESVAFLGKNGAGKSTLLKLICGVTHPNSGTVKVNGRVSALLELTAGFDESLTGLENIKLRCQLWGMSEQESERITPQVVDFADLGVYLHQPLRTYSSGMRARLGFALAVSVNPDILIIDEALSVGDKYFAQKCLKRVHELMERRDMTVLFVTHSLTQAREFCRRGMVLKEGALVYDGYIDDAIRYYLREYD